MGNKVIFGREGWSGDGGGGVGGGGAVCRGCVFSGDPQRHSVAALWRAVRGV